MTINQVLVVYKQVSTTADGRRGRQALHLATLDELYEILKDMGISFEAQGMRQLRSVGDVDLVITVGGDGTVLAASHFVSRQPILGIKSFGRQSVGYFCAATRKTMRSYIKSIIAGRRKPIRLHRLQTAINGKTLAEPVLNDVLFSSVSPASTSKYKLTVGRRSEEQKSSGIWISSAAGSTAAFRSAGGSPLPLTSNKIAYIVREPYQPGRRYKLLKGVMAPGQAIKVTSLMPQGTVSIDGGAIQYPAPYGAVIAIRDAGRPLAIFWR